MERVLRSCAALAAGRQGLPRARQRCARAPVTAMHDTSVVTLCSATLGEDGALEPPLGPLYIAAALEQIGVEVDFRDLQADASAHGFSDASLVACLDGHAGIVA